MQGNSSLSNKKIGTFRSWVENEINDIKYNLFEKARDFINETAEGNYNGNLILDNNKWNYLAPNNKKEGYKGSFGLDENNIPFINLTYHSFKHAGFTKSFDSKRALRELWELKKSGFNYSYDYREFKKTNLSVTNNEESNIDYDTILKAESALWDSLELDGESEYLSKKKLSNLKGVRFGENFIAVRIINTNGDFFGLQKIFDNGFKKFTTGLKKKGHFALIGREKLSFDIKTIHVCEGVSTAGSIHMATLEPVVAALDAFNLESVVRNLKQKYKKAKIIIWADNDRWKEDNLAPDGSKIGNTGLIHANFAALMIRNTLVATPNFDSIPAKAKELKLTDFNDVHVNMGLSAFDDVVFEKPDINIALTKKIVKAEKLQHGLLSPKQLFDGHKATVDSKYLPEYKLCEGINLIRSPIGTGKTQVVEEYIKSNKDKSVIFLTHLVSLIEDAASRLELKSYSECDNFDLQMQKRIAICLNSIGKLTAEGDLPKYDILVIDEIEQVLNRITSKLEQKPLIFSVLKELMTNTKIVACLDAHLSDTTMSLVKSWCGNRKINIIFNEYKVGQDRDIILYDDKEDLQVKAINELQNNKNAYLTFNSKNEAKKTFYLIKKALPNKKGLYISSDNNGDKEVRAFFNNVNKESQKYDYIICTPSISTGVSISNNHFDFVAGIFNCDITTPNDCMQAIGRVRGSKQIHVFTEKRIADKPLDPKTIALRWNETHRYDLNLMGLTDLGKKIVISDDYEMLRTKTTQNRNRGLNNFFYEFCLLNKVDGYNILHSDFKLNKGEKSNLKEVKDYYVKTTKQDDLVKAEDIDSRMANIIENKSRKQASETLSFEKHKLVEFYNIDKYNDNEIKDFSLLDDNGKLRSKVNNLEITLNNLDYAKKLFMKQIESSEQFSPDLKHFATKQEFYQKMLKELKLMSEDGRFNLDMDGYNHKYNKESLLEGDFFLWIQSNYSVIQGLFNIKSLDNIKNEPIRFISKRLSELGIEQMRIGKSENGNYSIKTQSVHFMVSILDKRNYFQGNSCELHMVNNTGTVPVDTVPKAISSLKSVLGGYVYHLNSKIMDAKNKYQSRYLLSMPFVVNT